MQNRIAAILAIITADTETQHRVCGAEEPADTAHEWADTGLEVSEIREYISAECFDADQTAALSFFGIDPDQAGHRVSGHTETIGYRVSSRDLSADEAAELLTTATA